MIVTPIRTDTVEPGGITMAELLDRHLPDMPEAGVLVLTSKIVALCEGCFIPIGDVDKQELLERESDLYLPAETSKYGHHFTIRDHTLVAMAGIDVSNGHGHYVLWPEDPQESANDIRQYLVRRFGLKQTGVIITDSTSMPLRLGSAGVAISHSGFEAVNDYTGERDIFGRTLEITRSNVAAGLAAAAVVTMGEGDERTPIAVIKDIPFVRFQDRDPSADELAYLHLSIEDDLFEPFLGKADWKPGRRRNS